MKSLSLYWKCQIIVWCMSIVTGTVNYLVLPTFTTFSFYPAIFLHATIGIIFIHLMRQLIVKRKLLELNTFKKVLYLIPVTIFYSVLYSIISNIINAVFHWESKLFAQMSFTRATLVMAFSNFFFFGIWNLAYFTYHYFRKSQLQQVNQIRLENELKLQQLESEKTKAELLQKETELQMQALRAEMDQVLKLQQMRARIASDLHDDIGSTLTSISYYSELVKMQLKEDDAPLKPVLEKMGESARSAVIAMSDIVWIINPKNDTTENLVNRMKRYAAEMLGVRNISYTFNTSEAIEETELDMQQRKNLYLIYKEAVHNAVKYAQCSKVDIDFIGTDHELSLSICDNGKGFDMQQANDGNGLTNMKKRAEEINAAFGICSAQNKGTQIRLTCKIT